MQGITKVRIDNLIDPLLKLKGEGHIYVDIAIKQEENKFIIIPSPYKAEDSDLNHLTENIV
jgi:hypothetical protein